jgi:hypothetical protein
LRLIGKRLSAADISGVDAVLGNPQIALRQIGNGAAVIGWDPTARDL